MNRHTKIARSKKTKLVPLFPIILMASLALLFSSPTIAKQAKQEQTLTIDNSWIRQAPPKAKVLAAYLQLNNPTNKPWTLLEVSSKRFKSIEIHRSTHHDGMMHMEQQDNVLIPAHQKVIFEPNGLHLMLIDPIKLLLAGDQVELKFLFKNGRMIIVNVPVQKRKMDHNSNHHNH